MIDLIPQFTFPFDILLSDCHNERLTCWNSCLWNH